jgi:hypothetical protein
MPTVPIKPGSEIDKQIKKYIKPQLNLDNYIDKPELLEYVECGDTAYNVIEIMKPKKIESYGYFVLYDGGDKYGLPDQFGIYGLSFVRLKQKTELKTFYRATLIDKKIDFIRTPEDWFISKETFIEHYEHIGHVIEDSWEEMEVEVPL